MLHEIEADGIRLVLTEHGTIKAAGGDAALDRWTPVMRRHKLELIDLLRSWAEREAAIQTCCEWRGDRDENRKALLADCWQESATDWPRFASYFQQEAAKWTH